jgi:hypothetical protein
VLVRYFGRESLRWQSVRWMIKGSGVEGFFTFFDMMLNAVRYADPPALATTPSGSMFGFASYREAARLHEERKRLRNLNV